MKIKIEKETLVLGIQKVQNIVSARASLPILSNILIESKANKLKMNATDLDIGISCEIPVETLEEGAITVPAKRFNDIIKELPSGDVVIHVKKNNHIDIEGKNCRFKLIGLPKEEFPKFPEFKDKEVYQIDQKLLKEMLQLTSFAVSHEESRYVLNGVLFDIVEDCIKLVATDGRRLAKIEKQLAHGIKKQASFIIPTKAIQEISRNLKEEGIVSFIVGANQVLFDIDGLLIATRIIEGEFPNYHQVVPKPSKNIVTVNTKEFLSAIRRADLLSTPDFKRLNLRYLQIKWLFQKQRRMSVSHVKKSRRNIMARN